MDTSDDQITFDENGECVYCQNFKSVIKPNWDTGNQGYKNLMKVADDIKNSQKNRDFDCIIGLSGGLDSSYTAYIAKEKMGLRPLLFHVDAGWNTDQAVGNIEKLCDGLNLDLYTEVIDWEKMKNVQLAFFKSQIPDQDLPQDASFFSALYKFARKNKIKHVVTGSNLSTECCREPESWGGYLGIDKFLFNDIISKHGDSQVGSFPIIDILTYKIFYQRVLGMKVTKPLDYVAYIKKDAEKELNNLFGWEKFQHKHHESRFTRFYEDYWLPKKFGFEKRRAHFSSLIMTDQMKREDAIERISRPEMDEHFLKKEFEYIAHKLDISYEDLQQIFDGTNKTFKDYKNKRWIINLGAILMRALGMEKRYFR